MENTTEQQQQNNNVEQDLVDETMKQLDQHQGQNPLDDPTEQAHFKQVVSAFFFYAIDAIRDIARMDRDFSKIPEEHLKLISFDFRKERIMRLKDCVRINQSLLNTIVQEHQNLFDQDKLPNGMIALRPIRVRPSDVIKMRSTLKSFMREWSAYGAEERQQAYQPVMDEVHDYFVNELGKEIHNKETGERISVLHPGCGLGRLVFEFALQGYKSQGNEFAYFCLLSSNFILNQTEKKESHEIYPFIHCFSNLKSEEQAFKKILVPDVCPNEVMTGDPDQYDFSMVAGEFVEVYGKQENQWDCVVTCFFIDTAHNIIEYIQAINKILKKGGLWVNIGPLLYHYSEQPQEVQIELSWEEIEKIIPQCGFQFRKKEFKNAVYTSNKDTLMTMNYNCIFFSAIKQ